MMIWSTDAGLLRGQGAEGGPGFTCLSFPCGMTESLRQMVLIPGHPTKLVHGPRHAGGITAELAATATEEPSNLENNLHPAPLYRSRRGAP